MGSRKKVSVIIFIKEDDKQYNGQENKEIQ